MVRESTYSRLKWCEEILHRNNWKFFLHIQGTKRKNIFILHIASNSFDSRVVGRYVVLVYIHNGFLQRLNTRIMVPSLSQVAYTINVCRLKEHNHLGVHLIRVFK